MSSTIEHHCNDLSALMTELTRKETLRALKGALLSEARRLRRIAVRNLKASGIRNADKISKAVRGKVLNNLAGFIVAADFRKYPEMGMTQTEPHVHKSKRLCRMKKKRTGKKPLAYWFDQGVEEGKRRGSIEGRHFIDKAKQQLPQSGERIAKAFEKRCKTIIAKHGGR